MILRNTTKRDTQELRRALYAVAHYLRISTRSTYVWVSNWHGALYHGTFYERGHNGEIRLRVHPELCLRDVQWVFAHELSHLTDYRRGLRIRYGRRGLEPRANATANQWAAHAAG